MVGWIKHLVQRWSQWSGDKDMEDAIREHLSDQGFYGKTAKICGMRLVAVQRPGWVQVYRFESTARVQQVVDEDTPDPEPEYADLYGLVRGDARKNLCDTRTFENQDDRRDLFAEWSDGLICLRGSQGLLRNP